jgi:hypothetical protein
MRSEDFEEVTVAINGWYRHFGLSASEHDTSILCSAALELFNHGRMTADDLSAGLLELFPVAELLKQNAPSSKSTH